MKPGPQPGAILIRCGFDAAVTSLLQTLSREGAVVEKRLIIGMLGVTIATLTLLVAQLGLAAPRVAGSGGERTFFASPGHVR